MLSIVVIERPSRLETKGMGMKGCTKTYKKTQKNEWIIWSFEVLGERG
jgi:hypothetical protein